MSIVKNVDLVYRPAPLANVKSLDEPAKGDFNNVLKSCRRKPTSRFNKWSARARAISRKP